MVYSVDYTLTDLKGDLLKIIGILFRKVSMRFCGLAEYIIMLLSRYLYQGCTQQSTI